MRTVRAQVMGNREEKETQSGTKRHGCGGRMMVVWRKGFTRVKNSARPERGRCSGWPREGPFTLSWHIGTVTTKL